jgi:hypothetical protein
MPSFKDDRPASRQPKKQSKPKANLKAKANPDHEYRYQSYSDSDDDHTDYSYSGSDAPSDYHTGPNKYVGERQRHARIGRTRSSFDAGRRHAAQWPNNASEQIGFILALLIILLLVFSNSGDWCHGHKPASFLSKQVAKLGVDFCVADNDFGRKGRYANADRNQAASRPPKIKSTSYSGQPSVDHIPLDTGKCKLVSVQR